MPASRLKFGPQSWTNTRCEVERRSRSVRSDWRGPAGPWRCAVRHSASSVRNARQCRAPLPGPNKDYSVKYRPTNPAQTFARKTMRSFSIALLLAVCLLAQPSDAGLRGVVEEKEKDVSAPFQHRGLRAHRRGSSFSTATGTAPQGDAGTSRPNCGRPRLRPTPGQTLTKTLPQTRRARSPKRSRL